MNQKRQRTLAILGLVLLAGAFGLSRQFATVAEGPSAVRPAGVSAPGAITVYKGPACQCCGKWAEHLRESGFEVEEEVKEEITPFIERHDVPRHLLSCHMAIVNDYLVVGHVPGDLVWRLLEERPEVMGISVPNMPLGSPGMEDFPEGREPPYDVIAFGPDGEFVNDSR